MNPDRYQRIKQLFDRATGLDGAARDAFLRDACGDDRELRREVEDLLHFDGAGTDDALDRAVERTSRPTPASESLPERIGPYRILRVCGTGGMGTVYEAEQQNPIRRVAVKVIQHGTARADTLGRFRREAEILGRLQHPGIAQIFEAGEFEHEGITRPYFAMEFVEGITVLDYANQRSLDVAGRVDLFVRICDVVHHAHQQGIVHRDLKPENILVVEQTGTPSSATALTAQPKVLDFGVARLADQDQPLTMATGDGQLIGSLPYMSPEQARGDSASVDARSDVYALGVVLFELLAHRLPYDVRGKALIEAVHVIVDGEPTRLGSVDAALRGDLETIAGKCLEKSPDRRYGSAAELADDLRRHRELRPITARPPSTWYQLHKFARRNRALVAGASATVIALMLGLVVAIVFALRAADNERDARGEAYRANLTAANALIESDPLAARRILDQTDPELRGWEWHHLHAQLNSHLLSFGSYWHEAPIAVTDGGRGILAPRDRRTVTHWDAETGEEIASWSAPDEVDCWGLSTDGDWLAAGLTDGRVLVRRRATDTDWTEWRGAGPAPESLTFSPDNTRLAIATRDSISLGSPTRPWRTASVRSRDARRVAFSSSGSRLVTWAFNSSSAPIELFDAADLTLLASQAEIEASRAVAFVRGDSRIAVTTYQRSVYLLDSTTLDRVEALRGHSDAVTSVDQNEHGHLVTASKDHTVRVWNERDVATHVLVHPDVRHAMFVTPTRLISASANQLRLWDLAIGARRVLRGHESYVYDLAFSPDGTLLTSHAPLRPSEVLSWDALTGERITRQGVIGGRAAALAMQPTGEILVIGGEFVQSLPWFAPGSGRGAFDPGLYFRFDPRRKHLVTTTADLVGLDPTTPRFYRIEHGIREDGTSVRCYADGEPVELEHRTALQPGVGDHPRLYVGSYGGEHRPMNGWIGDLVVYSGWPDDRDARRVEDYLATRRRGEDAALPTVTSATLIAHFRADDRTVRTDATHEDAPVTSWVASNDHSLELRGLGFPASNIQLRPADAEGPERVLIGNTHQDGRWLETALPEIRGADRVTVFWLGSQVGDWYSGHSTVYSIQSPAIPDALRNPVRRYGSPLSFSADGSRVAQGSKQWPRTAIVRDATTWEILGEFGPRSGREAYYGVASSPDGRRLACGAETGHLDVWDIDTGERIAHVEAHAGRVYSVDWSPDGRRIVTGGNDNVIRLWDPETFENLLELRGHEQYVKAVAFSPDGSVLASASGDLTVRLWDTRHAIERRTQLAERRRVEVDMRDELLAWLEETGDVHAVAERVRRKFADRPDRCQVALRLLATF